MLDAIAAVNATIGTTVLLVTHDPEVAARMPRRITIRDGRIGAEGRGGEDLAVIGRDGSLQLPPDIIANLPAGSLLRVRLLPSGDVLLERRDNAHDAPAADLPAADLADAAPDLPAQSWDWR